MVAEKIAESNSEVILKLIDKANSEDEEFETVIKSAVHESQSDTSLCYCDTFHQQYKTESGLTRHVINKLKSKCF